VSDSLLRNREVRYLSCSELKKDKIFKEDDSICSENIFIKEVIFRIKTFQVAFDIFYNKSDYNRISKEHHLYAMQSGEPTGICRFEYYQAFCDDPLVYIDHKSKGLCFRENIKIINNKKDIQRRTTQLIENIPSPLLLDFDDFS
jgi:hypothetical protein